MNPHARVLAYLCRYTGQYKFSGGMDMTTYDSVQDNNRVLQFGNGGETFQAGGNGGYRRLVHMI